MTPRDDSTLLDADELLDVLRDHEGPSEPHANGSARGRSSHTRPGAHRVALLGVAVAAALLLGSSLGFGLGASVTPSGEAGDNVVGFGFLPARGWNVVQTGTLGADTKGYAVAANIPLRHVAPDETALPALESLPRHGIVIVAWFGLRGDPAEDVHFPAGRLPLRFEDAERVDAETRRPRPASTWHHRLRVGVGGSNVDARIVFGSEPTRRMIDAAQRQLERLVVAADQVTIAARPSIARWIGGAGTLAGVSVTLFGATDQNEAGESIEIQAKDCGQTFFRVAAGASTVAGGGWSTQYFPGITTTLRAVWNGKASRQITVRQRALATLRRVRPGLFEVSTRGKVSFWRKRMLIQQFDSRLGTWKTLRSVVLTEQSGAFGGASFSGQARILVPKGTRLRSTLPQSQAGPCYLAGTSLPFRA